MHAIYRGCVPRHNSMDEQKQYQLRELAQQHLSHAENTDEYNLAVGTLELLAYVDQLRCELELATETCCEAMSLVYEHAV